MTRTEIVGRVLFQSDFNTAESILSQFKPLLKKPKYVEQIFNAVQEQFADESPENRRLIFIGTVYQIYQPLSYLENKADKRASGKLPTGVRDEIARCLQFNNPEMANHFRKQVEPWMKPFNSGPERPFKTKVMEIVERFKCYSINPEDTQSRLF